MTRKTVLVTGGTGQLGREVVTLLREAGHTARIASRRAAPSGSPTDWVTVDYRTSAGVAAALTGVDAVVHCASGSPRGERETMTALLSAAAARPAPPHLVYISIVGVDRIPMSYYAAKLAAEAALASSGLPHTVVRATQFHSLVAGLIRTLSRLPVVLLPRGIAFQPIAIGAVAARLVELAVGEPQGRVADLGGPEVLALPELARIYLTSVHKRRKLLEVPVPGAFMTALRAGGNLIPEQRTPGQTFAQYVTRS